MLFLYIKLFFYIMHVIIAYIPGEYDHLINIKKIKNTRYIQYTYYV